MKTLEQLGVSPAPWKVCKFCPAVTSINAEEVCDLSDDENADADARLIAAAPDLYAAALPFVSLMDWMLKSAAPLGVLDMVPAMRRHGDALRRALAKAGGEDRMTGRTRYERNSTGHH